MREEALGHEIVRLDGPVDVATVNTDSDTHEHELWSLCDLAIDLEKVRALEGLESEVLIMEVTVIDDCGIECCRVVHYDSVGLFRDHASRLAILRIDYRIFRSDRCSKVDERTIIVEVTDDLREALLCLLV